MSDQPTGRFSAEPGEFRWIERNPTGHADWPVLETRAVHLWRLPLDLPFAQPGTDPGTELDDTEHERAGRLMSSRDRLRFVAARVLLRRILARYVGREPRSLRFQVGAHGKPALLHGDGWSAPLGTSLSEVCFSLSHSEHIALLGVALGVQIGVDVEIHRPLPDAVKIAEAYFSAAECARLRELRPDERLPAFFDLWTCKEAFVKALGVGMSMPLDCFEVVVGPGRAPSVVSVDGSEAAGRLWTLFGGNTGAGTSSAIAMQSATPMEVSCFSCVSRLHL